MAYPLFAVPNQLETVLLVENEPLVRIGLAEFLRENGYRVFEAHDAPEALSLLASGPVIDLIIADIELPGEMDGFALARRIKAEWPEIPFIATSGVVRSIAADDVGAPILVKPYTRQDLLERVETALHGGAGAGPGPAPS
jgi:two-component system, response regulator PdtaR